MWVKLDSILKLKNISGLKYKRLFYPEETHISEPVKAFYDGIRFVILTGISLIIVLLLKKQ
jgi:hypothetical protein